MAAPKGNQFWKARSKHGRDKIFASDDLLWEACQEYFQWVENNPLMEAKAFSFQGSSWIEKVPKMRAMTISGICLFLDIGQSTWNDWKNGGDKDFSAIITRAEEVMRTQKFTGAAADLLNPNIIARDLGLVDKSQTNHSGTIDVNKMSDEELERKIAELMNATAIAE